MSENNHARALPTVFVSHGPGPYPICWKHDSSHTELVDSLENVLPQLGVSPAEIKCVLVVSAHWESRHTDSVRVTAPAEGRHPTLLYDYSGFPDYTYQLQYDCPSAPAVARRVQDLLEESGIGCVLDPTRNLDHGVFVPLSLMLPDAQLPVIQLSLPALTRSGVDNAKRCLEMGSALAPLRHEGVLVVASGSATHGRFRGEKDALEFMDSFRDVVTQSPEDRGEALIQWETLPHARDAHGREEHLLPLHVAVGASQDAQGVVLSDGWWNNLAMTQIGFGLSS